MRASRIFHVLKSAGQNNQANGPLTSRVSDHSAPGAEPGSGVTDIW